MNSHGPMTATARGTSSETLRARRGGSSRKARYSCAARRVSAALTLRAASRPGHTEGVPPQHRELQPQKFSDGACTLGRLEIDRSAPLGKLHSTQIHQALAAGTLGQEFEEGGAGIPMALAHSIFFQSRPLNGCSATRCYFSMPRDAPLRHPLITALALYSHPAPGSAAAARIARATHQTIIVTLEL